MACTTVVVAMALFALHPAGLVGELSYLAGFAAATVLAWVATLGRPRAVRGPWMWLAVGVSLNTVADATHQLLVWGGLEPVISVADVLWISSALALAVGMGLLSHTRRAGRGLDVEALIDALVALVVTLLVVWELALERVVSDTGTTVMERAVLATYPVLDAVLLCLVVRMLISRARSLGLLLLAAGATCWLGTDFGFLIDTDGSAATALGLGWMAAMLLVGVGMLAAPSQTPELDDYLAQRRGMWLVIAPLAVPVAFLLWGQITHEHPNAAVMLGGTVALIGLAAARTERLLRAVEAAREEVQARQHLFEALAANASDAVYVLDADGILKEGAESLAKLLGVRPDDVRGVNLADRFVRDTALVDDVMTMALASPGVVFEETAEVVHADGGRRWFQGRIVNLLDDPVVAGLVVNVSDITARKRAEDELRHQAFHDSLTGLANRALLDDRIGQAQRRSARRGVEPAVIYLDVDGFKAVNDRLGHEAGDRLLREIARRLLDTVRVEDTVARMGGDEFAVLVEEHHAEAGEVRTTAERILQALSAPVEVCGQVVGVSASIGVAVGVPGRSAEELLHDADIAMYRAKAAGKGRVVEYDEAMGTEAHDAVHFERELGRALAGEQFELHYQPVVDLGSDRLAGFEALVRWRHPQLGLVAPDRFIPVAEHTGLIRPIGRWVLHTACATAARWRAAGAGPMRPFTMSVNVSGRQLASDEIVDDVRAALAASGLDPCSLVLEMTETSLVSDPAAAARRLRALRELGVRIAIDDFGTGYSYLRQFPIDILKIDRSFIETITDPTELPPIVRGLLDLGRTLQLDIVAEGIETGAQRDGLRFEHCDLGQGYLFSRPLPVAEAERLLSSCPPLTLADDLPALPAAAVS